MLLTVVILKVWPSSCLVKRVIKHIIWKFLKNITLRFPSLPGSLTLFFTIFVPKRYIYVILFKELETIFLQCSFLHCTPLKMITYSIFKGRADLSAELHIDTSNSPLYKMVERMLVPACHNAGITPIMAVSNLLDCFNKFSRSVKRKCTLTHCSNAFFIVNNTNNTNCTN